jgi:hypothetical protein
VEASELSGALAEGEAAGGDGEAAATTGGGVPAGAGDLAGATGVGEGEACATIIGDFAGEGDGVGVPFLFFLSAFDDFVGDAGGGVGVGEATTFGGSIWAACSTRINWFAGGGGGVGARPATTCGV